MACPKYNGNWLLVDDIRRVNEERRIAQIPLGCGRNVCSYCGEINRRRFYVELVEGYKRVIAENPNMVLDLLTVTFRTKPASMTWKQWVARNDFTDEEIEDIEATMKRAEEWDAYNLYKLIYEYWEMGPKWIIYARHAMSPRQWSRYISICMKTLWFYWKEKYGENYYTRITELTKQGNPHVHCAVVVPKGMHNQAMLGWIRKTWQHIALDSYHISMSRLERKYLSQDDRMIAGYIAKYLSKDWENSADWKGVRRTAKSLAFKKPVIMCKDAAEWIHQKTGEILPFNKPEYRAAYGRMYYYKKKLEELGEKYLSGIELQAWMAWRALWRQMNSRVYKYTTWNTTDEEMKGKSFVWYEYKYRHRDNVTLAVWRDGLRKVIA